MDNATNYFHHDIEDFKNYPVGADDNKLRILQWNVRGINDMNQFDSVLQFLELCECSFDVIFLGETWISSYNCSLYKI